MALNHQAGGETKMIRTKCYADKLTNIILYYFSTFDCFVNLIKIYNMNIESVVSSGQRNFRIGRPNRERICDRTAVNMGEHSDCGWHRAVRCHRHRQCRLRVSPSHRPQALPCQHGQEHTSPPGSARPRCRPREQHQQCRRILYRTDSGREREDQIEEPLLEGWDSARQPTPVDDRAEPPSRVRRQGQSDGRSIRHPGFSAEDIQWTSIRVWTLAGRVSSVHGEPSFHQDAAL